MQIQRLVDLEDYEFDTLLVTYNHKNRLSIELGKVSEIFESLQADGLVVMLNIDAVGEVGGGIHCATHEQPKV